MPRHQNRKKAPLPFKISVAFTASQENAIRSLCQAKRVPMAQAVRLLVDTGIVARALESARAGKAAK